MKLQRVREAAMALSSRVIRGRAALPLAGTVRAASSSAAAPNRVADTADIHRMARSMARLMEDKPSSGLKVAAPRSSFFYTNTSALTPPPPAGAGAPDPLAACQAGWAPRIVNTGGQIRFSFPSLSAHGTGAVPLFEMGRNSRAPKQANHGKRPNSHVRRRLKKAGKEFFWERGHRQKKKSGPVKP